MSFHLHLLVLFFCRLVPVSSYHNGAPKSSCANLNTGGPHRNSTATGVPPYNISLSSNHYTPGQVIQVTLSGTGGATFKGFLIAARHVGGNSDNIGFFSAQPESHIVCNSSIGDAVTHSDNTIKSSVSFNWTAPSTSEGDLIFHYTVVRSGAPSTTPLLTDYFQGLTSVTLNDASVISTTLAPGTFTKNPDCGKTRGCFSDCQNNVCGWELSWRESGDSYEFTIKASAASDNHYVSIGFNKLGKMSPSSVVSCVVHNATVEVLVSFNRGYANTLAANPKDGIRNETNSLNNGILECSFLRETISSNSEIFNLTEPLYLITAVGNTGPDGSLKYHGSRNKFSSKTEIDFSNVTTDESFSGTVTTTSPASPSQTTHAPGTFTKNPDCGKTRGCFSDCQNNVCGWELSWRESGDSYEFTIKASAASDNHYVSIGFNKLGKMSPSSVVSCVVHNATVEVLVSFNRGYANTLAVNPKDGIRNETNSLNNGILKCSFLRETISSNSEIFNLTEPLYLITAAGDTGPDGSLTYHGSSNKFSSKTEIDFSNVTTDESFSRIVTTTSPASPSQTTVAPKTFSKNPECGKTMGCFSDCSSNVCSWELSWKDEGDNYQMIIKASMSGDNQYVALGVNKGAGMSPASVVSCVAHRARVEVLVSQNVDHSNTPATNPKEGISKETNSYTNGVLQCSFLRESTSSNPQIYNLTEPLYLITAKGPADPDDGSLGIHSNKYASAMPIDFSKTTTDDSFSGIVTTPSTPASKFHKDPECGITKGCYSNCRNNECDLMLSWAFLGPYFEITLTSGYSHPGNHYVALGFSDADNMGPASVVACVVYNNQINMLHTCNQGYSNNPFHDPHEGLSNMTGSYQNGVLTCTCRRETKSLNNTLICDLTKDWYLISARGTVFSDNSLSQHAADQAYKVESRIDFKDPHVDISLDDPDFTLVKAHGCLMTIAWMLAASIGLAMARFTKNLWPDSKLCGVKIWFAVHRAVMVSVFVLGISAFVIIFIYTDGYSNISGEAFKKAHPILGIIVTSLLFINPFMSLLRCAPDHPRRPIFNWAHWFVGTSSHILGGVAITFGLYLPKSRVDTDIGLIIMIIYFSWHAFFFIVMSGIDYAGEKRSKTVSMGGQPLELTGKHAGSINVADSIDTPSGNSYKLLEQSKEPPYSSVKKVMLVVHVLMLLALTACIVYLIIAGSF